MLTADVPAMGRKALANRRERRMEYRALADALAMFGATPAISS